MAHDFFQEQTLVADAYLLRYIFHNWNDVDCGRILKALRPALRQGTKLLVMELVQENHAVSPESWFEDRIVRYVLLIQSLNAGLSNLMILLLRRRDMQMMSFIGASERSIKDYEELVRNSIPEFKFSGYHRPAGSFVAMLEWTFLGA